MRPNGKCVHQSRDLTPQEKLDIKDVLFPGRGKRSASESQQAASKAFQAGSSSTTSASRGETEGGESKVPAPGRSQEKSL